MNPAARLELRHIRHDDRGRVTFMAGGEENHDILQEACGTISESCTARGGDSATSTFSQNVRLTRFWLDVNKTDDDLRCIYKY
jgi:hypothetical protein